MLNLSMRSGVCDGRGRPAVSDPPDASWGSAVVHWAGEALLKLCSVGLSLITTITAASCNQSSMLVLKEIVDPKLSFAYLLCLMQEHLS